jgi:glycerol-3-phosphate acyltransferase PlsY
LIYLLVPIAYLIGSVPVGVLVGRVSGFDPRAVGSGNVGMTNVARAGGRSAAAITLAGDLLKGLIPVLVARAFDLTTAGLALVGLSAFIGSLYSIFLGFEGGKGVSTTLGVWLGLAPSVIGCALVVFLVVFLIRRIVSLASLTAALALPLIAVVLSRPPAYVATALIMAALVVYRHRGNVWRLMRGEEEPLSLGRGKADRVRAQ